MNNNSNNNEINNINNLCISLKPLKVYQAVRLMSPHWIWDVSSVRNSFSWAERLSDEEVQILVDLANEPGREEEEEDYDYYD